MVFSLCAGVNGKPTGKKKQPQGENKADLLCNKHKSLAENAHHQPQMETPNQKAAKPPLEVKLQGLYIYFKPTRKLQLLERISHHSTVANNHRCICTFLQTADKPGNFLKDAASSAKSYLNKQTMRPRLINPPRLLGRDSAAARGGVKTFISPPLLSSSDTF